MADKQHEVKVTLTELQKTKLEDGAKYIFCLDPLFHDQANNITDALIYLIGEENFVLLGVPGNALKVYEVADEQDK